MRRVTMFDVLRALKKEPGGSLAGDLPIKGNVQAISNALRHARYRRWVQSEPYGNSGNVSVWYLTEDGLKVLQQ